MKENLTTWLQAISQKDTPLSWWQAWQGDPNDLSDNGFTPLLFSAWDGNASLMRLLLKKGADPNVTYQGKTLIQLAVESQEPEAILFALSCYQDLSNPFGPGRDIASITRPLGMHGVFLEALTLERERRANCAARNMDDTLPEPTPSRERERL